MALDASVSQSRCFGHALKEADAPAQTFGAQLVSLVLDNVCLTSDSGTSWCRVGGAAQIFGTNRRAQTGGDLVPSQNNEEDGLTRRGWFRCLVTDLTGCTKFLLFVSERGRRAELKFSRTLLVIHAILDAG